MCLREAIVTVCNIRYSFGFFNPQGIWLPLKDAGPKLGIDASGIEKGLQPTAIAIDTRFRILKEVVAEAKKRIAELLAIPTGQELRSSSVALPDNVVYGTLAMVDAFFFESGSVRKLLERFYVGLLRRTRIQDGCESSASFQALVRATEQGFRWDSYLRANRDQYTHQTAPYPAILFSDQASTQPKLVFESDPEVYLDQRKFDYVLQGLEALARRCREDLIAQVRNARASGGGRDR